MPTERKVKAVGELEQTMAKSNIIVVSDYRGVKAPQITGIRRKLRASNSEMKVVKNTLARLAASKAGKEALIKSLEGTTAITFGYGDITATVKALVGAQADAEGFVVRGGMLGDRMYGRDEILSIATLPSREILLGRVLGQMNAPVSRLVGVLASPMRGFMGILQARIRQLEETA
jgi:large subunit ribosomal protein L10